MNDTEDNNKRYLGSNARAAPPNAQAVPLVARLSHEIPRPKDWQAFQRNCVILYRAELNDPHAQEYGRDGQAQYGIDILGRRNGKPDHWVGIQCRRVTKALNKDKILADCRSTLALRAELKEIIFATTAPNDTSSTDAAIEVEDILRSEGRDLRVTVLGWDNLCLLIAMYPSAYAAFYPASVATERPLHEANGSETTKLRDDMNALSAQLAAMRITITSPSDGTNAQEQDHEDKALHAKIDTYRDLFKNDHQLGLADTGLKSLIGTFEPSAEPRADFRIKFNLGSIALELGRETEAIAYYEAAHAVRPTDPMAVANLALARMLGRRFEEAMDLAREALAGSPPAKHAVGYLLQAAARSNWQGDPEELVPVDIAGTVDADLGLAEFWRLREVPSWPKRVIELSRNHPNSLVFKRLGALSVLTLVSTNNMYLPGGNTSVNPVELNDAADELKENVEYLLGIGFTGTDLAAHASNSAVILRYCGRNIEAEDILTRTVKAGVTDTGVLRMLGLVQSLQGKREAALKTLEPLTQDGEAMLLVAEIIAERSPQEALKHITTLPDEIISPQHKSVRWQIAAEAAIRLKDSRAFEHALAELKSAGGLDVTIELLQIRDLEHRGATESEIAERARAVAATVPADIEMSTRVLIAGELRNFNRPLEASRLLDGHVDLGRMSPAALLYLQSLAGARRDDAFLASLKNAAREVRECPEVLWLQSTHAWNVGDLGVSLKAVEAFLVERPDNFRARLLQIEILARQNNSTEIEKELSRPIEEIRDASLEGQLRIVTLLSYFGFTERAAAFAYRLFLQHRDDPRIWMAFSSVLLSEGNGSGTKSWDMPSVAPDAAVDVTFDDGERQFFVIESDAELLRLDLDSREPDHPLAAAVSAKVVGNEFTVEGRKGQINGIRHKYVARFHYILENYEKRFPTIFGFRGVKFDPGSPDGLDDVKAQLAARDNWVRAQSELYQSGNIPLAVLAMNTGSNSIDAASGVGSYGIKLKVALGNEIERQLAARSVAAHKRGGCVLDLWTYWTAHRLGALEVIQELFGELLVTQHTLDELRIYRSKAAESLETGLHTMSMKDGAITLTEALPDYVSGWVADIDQAINWIEKENASRAVVATDKLPDVLLEHLQFDTSHLFDEMVLALHSNLILLSDDLPLRNIAASLGVRGGVWLHWLAGAALERGKIDYDEYVTWSAALIEAGQTYLGISGAALTAALEKDVANGQTKPGNDFLVLSKVIGGKLADPRSHIEATLSCIRTIWADAKFAAIRQQATSQLLRKLLHERTKDYKIILRTLALRVRDDPILTNYVVGWAIGHFISDALHKELR